MHVYTYKHTHKFGFVNNHIGHLPKVIPLLEISIVLTYPFIFCVPIHSIGQHRLEFGIIPGATRGAYNLTFRLVSAFVGASRDLIFSCVRCRQLPCPAVLAVPIEPTPATSPSFAFNFGQSKPSPNGPPRPIIRRRRPSAMLVSMAGHVASISSLAPTRWIAKVLRWRDCMCNDTVRGLHLRASDPDR